VKSCNTERARGPQTGRIVFGVSILSYNGKVRLGIATDKGLTPDPEAIIELFCAEYDEMRSRAKAVRVERPKDLKALLSMLEKAYQILDELIDKAGRRMRLALFEADGKEAMLYYENIAALCLAPMMAAAGSLRSGGPARGVKLYR
jgi:hypothetical protein